MKASFKLNYIDGQYIARAFAILLVVANHASVNIELSGGMLVLLFISGFNLLKFSVGKSNKQLVIYFLKFSMKIAIPCFLISCGYFLFYQKVSIDELLFYNNWVKLDSIPWLPSWYPQMILQATIVIVFFFLVFKPSNYIQKNIMKFSLLSFLIAFSLLPITYVCQLIGIATSEARLPFSYLWCLVLGWLIYACKIVLPEAYNNFISILLCIVIASICVIPHEFLQPFVLYPHQGLVSFVIFSTLTSLFIFNPRVLMPKIIVSLVKVIANATFTIFLMHMSFFYLYYVFTDWVTQSSNFRMEMYLFSITGSVVLWIFWDAFEKAYFQTKRLALSNN